MQKLLVSLTLLLVGCGGQEFSGYEQENNEASFGGGAGEASENRGGSQSTSVAGIGAMAGAGYLGGSSASTAGQSPGGASPVAGRSSMGEGGSSGEGTSGENAAGGAGGDSVIGPAQCLANHQNLECARVCDSQPSCQGILDCFIRTNSNLTSNCPGFSDMGYTLAQAAERNCCHE